MAAAPLPDSLSNFVRWAADALDAHLTGAKAASRLAEREMSQYQANGFRPVAGWTVPLAIAARADVTVRLLISDDFPYAPPRVAVHPAPRLFSWPHVERDGKLCLLPTDSTIDSADPTGVADCVLEEAQTLLDHNLSGRTEEDYRDEFLTYWSYTVKDDTPRILSLCEPHGPSRTVFLWHGGSFSVAADTTPTLRRWLVHRGARPGPTGEYRFCAGVLLWLPAALVPPEFPQSSQDVARLARAASAEFTAPFEISLRDLPRSVVALLGAPWRERTTFAAVSLLRPSGVSHGFRGSKVPAAVVSARYLSSPQPARPHKVVRIDPDWIHGRGSDSSQSVLREARVAVLGCGSLGSTIAMMMARAGVGHLLLVDPERMESANAGRHLLGIESLGEDKAAATKRRILSELPHIGSVEAEVLRVAPTNAALLERLASYALIVSTTGNWSAECLLNDRQRSGTGFPKILYGWIEAHAAAAHAALILPTGACLRCGRTPVGRPLLPVTTWPDSAAIAQEPACGATFSPYGPMDLVWAHALIGQTAISALLAPPQAPLHNIWVGNRWIIDGTGGTWAEEWVETDGQPGDGGFTKSRGWPCDPECAARGHVGRP